MALLCNDVSHWLGAYLESALHMSELCGELCSVYCKHFGRQCYDSKCSLRPRHKGRHFPDSIFKWIFLNENVWISIKISLKFVPRCLINNIPSLAQIMAWHRTGGKPLSKPMIAMYTGIFMHHSALMSWIEILLRIMLHWCHFCKIYSKCIDKEHYNASPIQFFF